MANSQKLCNNCVRAFTAEWSNGSLVCEKDKAAHYGIEFCPSRIGKEELAERAKGIRNFVQMAADVTLVKMFN